MSVYDDPGSYAPSPGATPAPPAPSGRPLPPDSGVSSGDPLPDSPNKRFMRSYVQNVIDAENPSAGDRYFVENFYNHDPAPGEQPGITGVEAFIGSIFSAFSGFTTNVNEQMAEGDFVVGRWTQTFKQTGSYLGFPVSGIQVLIGGITITRVRNNRILEEWEARDAAGLLQQMGVAPKLSLEGGEDDMPPVDQDVNDVVKRFFYDAWNAGNPELVGEILAPDFVNHIRLDGQKPGREGVRQLLERFRTAFPDGSISIDLMITEQDRVATRFTARGTHRDAFMGLAATNKSVEFTGIQIFRVARGQLVEGWGYLDLATLLLQLGALQLPTGGSYASGNGGNGSGTWPAGGGQPGGGSAWPGSPGPGPQGPGTQGGGNVWPSSGDQGAGWQPGGPQATGNAWPSSSSQQGSGGSWQPGGPGGGSAPTPGSPEDVARRWFDAVNNGDEGTLQQLVAPDVVDHSGLSQAHGRGAQGHTQLVRELRRTLPAWRSTIESVAADRDLVTIRHTGRARLPRRYGGLATAAGDQPIEFEMVSTVRVRNGKIVEHWANSGPFGNKGGTAASPSSPDALKQIAKRWFDAINRGDIAAIDELVDYDVVDHSGLSGRHGYGCHGHKQLVQELRNTIPDWRSQIQEMTVDGDTVIVRHVGSGTAPPELAPLAGAGARPPRFDFEMVSTVRIVNGKIVEHWANKGPFGNKAGSATTA